MDGNAGSENFGQQDGSSIDISKKQVHVFSHSLSTGVCALTSLYYIISTQREEDCIIFIRD